MKRALIATASIALLAAGGSSTGAASRPSAPSPASLEVTSSIKDGSSRQRATAWTAKSVGVTDADPVAEVDFTVDGKNPWTSTQSPYVFGLDHPVAKRIFPWLFNPGTHRFTVTQLFQQPFGLPVSVGTFGRPARQSGVDHGRPSAIP